MVADGRTLAAVPAPPEPRRLREVRAVRPVARSASRRAATSAIDRLRANQGIAASSRHAGSD